MQGIGESLLSALRHPGLGTDEKLKWLADNQLLPLQPHQVGQIRKLATTILRYIQHAVTVTCTILYIVKNGRVCYLIHVRVHGSTTHRLKAYGTYFVKVRRVHVRS